MFIQIRDFDLLLEKAGAAAENLASVLDGADDKFMTAAWELAEIVAPVRLEPLGFLLNPENIERYRDSRPFSVLWKPPSMDHNLWRSTFTMSDLNRLDVELKNLVVEKINLPPHTDRACSDFRRWVYAALKALSPPTGYGFLRDATEDQIHLAAFIAFSFGDIAHFSRAALDQVSGMGVGEFWKCVFRWHAGEPDKDALLNLVKDDKLSLGKRKLALLLAWTMPSGELVDITRKHEHLLARTIEYRGSGMLPCRPFKIPSTRSIDDILKELEKAAKALPKKNAGEHWKKQVMPLVEEVMGGSAACVDFRARIDLLTKPDLRGMVFGFGEIERQSAVLLLMQFPRVSKRNPLEWNNGDIVESYSILKAAIRAKKGAPGKIAGLLGNPCHLKGIHSWTPDGIALTARLLDHDIGNVVIGSQAIDWLGKIDGDTSLSLRLQGVTIQIPSLSERRRDIDGLLRKFLGNKQISADASLYVRKLRFSSQDDLILLLQEAGKNTDDIQLADIERAEKLILGKMDQFAMSTEAAKFFQPSKYSLEMHSKLSQGVTEIKDKEWTIKDLIDKCNELFGEKPSERHTQDWVREQIENKKIEKIGKTRGVRYRAL